jgi:hypothetical protein
MRGLQALLLSPVPMSCCFFDMAMTVIWSLFFFFGHPAAAQQARARDDAASRKSDSTAVSSRSRL